MLCVAGALTSLADGSPSREARLLLLDPACSASAAQSLALKLAALSCRLQCGAAVPAGQAAFIIMRILTGY